jgi:hypothetical protein
MHPCDILVIGACMLLFLSLYLATELKDARRNGRDAEWRFRQVMEQAEREGRADVLAALRREHDVTWRRA